MTFDIQVFDLKHLNDILSRLRVLPMINSVQRVIG
jgi:(p)ppGpp synthase/HD superfamily hydrolase